MISLSVERAAARVSEAARQYGTGSSVAHPHPTTASQGGGRKGNIDGVSRRLVVGVCGTGEWGLRRSETFTLNSPLALFRRVCLSER